MISKFVLVVIIMTSNGQEYMDFVDKPSDTKQECEDKKNAFLQQIKKRFDKSHYYFASCVSPRGLHSVDV